MEPAELSSSGASQGDTLDYAYKPSLLGPAHEFRLDAKALEWSGGRRTLRIPLERIRRIRLSFRPQSLQNYRFVAEVWSEGAPKLTIASTSWRGMVDQQRHDAAYRAFVSALTRRAAASGAGISLETGSPPALYWPGLALFIGVSVLLAALVVRALQAGAFAGAAFVAVFFVLCLWQIGGFFRRNRPGRYRPDAIPSEVLPRA